jgi:hypothetical protein
VSNGADELVTLAVVSADRSGERDDGDEPE